jgi:hypothetical protein
LEAQQGLSNGFVAGIQPATGEVEFASMGLPTAVREAKFIFVDKPVAKRRLKRRMEKRIKKIQNPSGLTEHIIVDHPVVECEPDFEHLEHLDKRQRPVPTAYVVYPSQPSGLALITVTPTGASPWLNMTTPDTYDGIGSDGYGYDPGSGERVAMFANTQAELRATNYSISAFFDGGSPPDSTVDPYAPSYVDSSAGDFAFTILAAILTGAFVLFVFGIGYWKMWEAGDGCFAWCKGKKEKKAALAADPNVVPQEVAPLMSQPGPPVEQHIVSNEEEWNSANGHVEAMEEPSHEEHGVYEDHVVEDEGEYVPTWDQAVGMANSGQRY